MGALALRSVSSYSIWWSVQISFFTYHMGPPSGQFIRLLNGPPGQFFRLLYMGAPSDQFLRLLYGGPLRSVLRLLYAPPPPDHFLHILCGDPLRSVSSLTIGGLLRSVSSHIKWGPLQINFFAYYVGAPLDKFLRKLYGPPSGQFLCLL